MPVTTKAAQRFVSDASREKERTDSSRYYEDWNAMGYAHARTLVAQRSKTGGQRHNIFDRLERQRIGLACIIIAKRNK